MKIAVLQFAPQLGKREENIQKAEKIIFTAWSAANNQKWDWLVLPEMAFSGYNFSSVDEIRPHLEPTAAGRSTQWAQIAAQNLGCHITVGYPEITTTNPPKHYNSTVTVNPAGQVILNYRKSFLYYTDELWAEEGDRRFFNGQLSNFGHVSHGICMDINPYKFTSPWTDYEFANAAVAAKSPLIVMSMAWLTHTPLEDPNREEKEADKATISYWIERLYPVVNATFDTSDTITLVVANRCGIEGGATYAGTSTILRIRNGKVELYDMLGKNEERCMVVDLDDKTKWEIQPRP